MEGAKQKGYHQGGVDAPGERCGTHQVPHLSSGIGLRSYKIKQQAMLAGTMGIHQQQLHQQQHQHQWHRQQHQQQWHQQQHQQQLH